MILKKLNKILKIRKKDLEKKFVVNTASKLFDRLLNIYKTQENKFSEDQKEKINVLNKPENVTITLIEVDLSPMPPPPPLEDDEEVKSEAKYTIAERVKLILRKKNRNRVKNLNSY